MNRPPASQCAPHTQPAASPPPEDLPRGRTVTPLPAPLTRGPRSRAARRLRIMPDPVARWAPPPTPLQALKTQTVFFCARLHVLRFCNRLRRIKITLILVVEDFRLQDVGLHVWCTRKVVCIRTPPQVARSASSTSGIWTQAHGYVSISELLARNQLGCQNYS